MPVSANALSHLTFEPDSAVADASAGSSPPLGLPHFDDGLPAAVKQLPALAAALGLAALATVTVPDGPPRAPRSSRSPAVGTGGRLFALGEDGGSRRLRHDDGPGLAACRTARPVVVEDVTGDPRWPGWSADADAAGFGSSLSMPLPARYMTGALDLWSPGPRHFDAADVARAADLAAVGAAILDGALRLQHLDRALEGRTVIGQAQGILIERHRLTPAAAFAVLSLSSQTVNRKVRDVSDELVATGQLPGSESGRVPVPLPPVDLPVQRSTRSTSRSDPSSAEGNTSEHSR